MIYKLNYCYRMPIYVLCSIEFIIPYINFVLCNCL